MVGSRGGAGFFKFKIWYLKFINNLGVLCVHGAKKLAARNLILKIQAAEFLLKQKCKNQQLIIYLVVGIYFDSNSPKRAV